MLVDFFAAIPPKFQYFVLYAMATLIGIGSTVIVWIAKQFFTSALERFKKMETNTEYLMKENQLSKEMIAFYEKEENTRRVAERRAGDRRKGIK